MPCVPGEQSVVMEAGWGVGRTRAHWLLAGHAVRGAREGRGTPVHVTLPGLIRHRGQVVSETAQKRFNLVTPGNLRQILFKHLSNYATLQYLCVMDKNMFSKCKCMPNESRFDEFSHVSGTTGQYFADVLFTRSDVFHPAGVDVYL